MIISLVGILLAVAFFTLIERKVIGLAHYRKGPNKVIIRGITQPISDAVKLITKEFSKLRNWKNLLFIIGPLLAIVVIIICWNTYYFKYNMFTTEIKLVIILSFIGLRTYRLTLIRWGSNSKYAILGGYRSIAQIISYEVCLVLFILIVVYSSHSLNTKIIQFRQENIWIAIFCLPIFARWLIICIAESNRTPFDISEGESEIVSGFNVEYGGGLFALIFIAEYGIIIFLNFITSIIFLGIWNIIIIVFLLNFLFIWVRCCFPRVRYDTLIIASWKILLPLRLGIIIFCNIFFQKKIANL